jgi:hypothetical protein
VHSPSGEPLALLEEKTTGLGHALCPGNLAEVGIVESMGRSMVRLQRAEGALEEALQRQGEVPLPNNDATDIEVARLQKERQVLAIMAELSGSIVKQEAIEIIALFTNAAKILKKNCQTEPNESISEAMLRVSLELRQAAERMKTPGAIVQKENAADRLKGLCEHVLKKYDQAIGELQEKQAAEHRLEEAIRQLPDANLTRRYDRYCNAIQKAVLRDLQILKEIRSMAGPCPEQE